MKDLYKSMLLRAILLVCSERDKVDTSERGDWRLIAARFRAKRKVEINSWAGDLFARVFNEMAIPLEYYEEFRAEYFID